VGTFKAFTRQGPISILADDKLKPFVDAMLNMTRDMDANGAEFRDGMVVLNGWCAYKFRGSRDLGWKIHEPDFDQNPYQFTREDCTFSLRILAQQFIVAERIGLKPSQLSPVSCFDKVLHRGVMKDRKVNANRLENRSGEFSGWFFDTPDRKTSENDDVVTDVASIVRMRPGLLPLLLLPVGYCAVIEGNDLRGIGDPQDRVVYDGRR